VVPTFTPEPFDGVGAQLCPCSLATVTPQTFTVASLTNDLNQPESSRYDMSDRCALRPSPDLPDSSWWFILEERSAAGFSRTPSRLACRTWTIWQYWTIPSLSGLLSTFTGVPRLWLPSASAGLLRQTGGGVL